MLGSYPSLTLHDPETYIATICSLLVGYPLWAGERAIDKAIIEAKFAPPSLGVLKPHLEDEVRTARYAQEWEETAERMRALPAPLRSPEERRAFIASRRSRDGGNFGLGSWKRSRQPATQDIRNEIIAQIGQEAFDAIPDIGDEGWRTLSEQMQKLTEQVSDEVVKEGEIDNSPSTA